MSRNWLLVPLLLAAGIAQAGAAQADDRPEDKPEPSATEAQAEKEQEQKAQAQKEQSGNLGMSILGNQEAPKALVIVPWKSSQLGQLLGISPMLDDSRQPVDKEVFMRALSYYEIRSGQK